jgi:hypothetical protein
MRHWRLSSVRLFVAAGLLLQVAGPLSFTAAASAEAPAAAGRSPASAKHVGEVLGFFAASDALSTPPAVGPAAKLNGVSGPSAPPPLPPAGDYYQALRLDLIANRVNTDVGGTIVTDTIWTVAGSPYVATSSVTVGPTATLTIEPGVVVNFEAGRALVVNGRLLAQGTSNQAITFAGTNPAPGFWGGIYFEGTPSNPLSGSQLAYFTVTGGGGLGSRPANIYLFHATVSINHAQISNSLRNGVYGGEGGLAHVLNTGLSNNGTASPEEAYAIWFTQGALLPDLSNLTLTGNSQNAIALGGGTLTTRTWKALDYPYVITGNQTVPPGASLTVEPGVQARFKEGWSLTINGQLLAQGTSGQPITFAGTSAAKGHWGGLYFEGTLANPLSGSQLSHVIVSDAGRLSSRPANIYLFHATVSINHAQISNSQRNGVYGGEGGLAHISDTTISNNGTPSHYAIWYAQGSLSPILSNLSLTGNGQNAIVFGGGTLTTRTWKALGYPYVLMGAQVVPHGATLTVEPGVTVMMSGNHQILVAGKLEALGEPGAPITFTAVSAAPGAWGGLGFTGQAGKLATGALRYTTVEYGGFCSACANVAATFAQVNISHSKLRFSSKAGVRTAANAAAGMVIENSHFVGNVAGVDNADPLGAVLATNNWWGHPSGPVAPGNCNLGGQGQTVTVRVAFLPFLTEPNAAPDEVAASQVLSLSLNPLRYYAPADGATQVWFEITLRDGAGFPVAGQVVRLRTNLGTATSGGTTDAAGKSFAYLQSNIAGEAAVFAELDGLTACEFVRSATSDISFTAPSDDPLSPDAQSPYSNAGVEFHPQPVIVGVPGVLRVRLHNPNPFAIRVNATFSYAQLGLGLLFGPVGQVNNVLIQPQSDGLLELPWVPLVSGHFCIRVDYTWQAATGAAAPSQALNSGRTGSNTAGAPGPMLRPFDKNAIRRASVATTSLGDITFAAAGLDSIAATGSPAASAPYGWLQGLMLGNILDFIFEGGGGIDCAMKGGTSCGGWKGPRMHYPGESLGNLSADPPSPDFRELVPLEILAFPPIAPDANISPAQAAAINNLVRAGLDLTSYLTAAAATYDRYAGAVAANEMGWATQHANAFSYYLKEGALRMDDVADKMEALVAVLHAENKKLLLAEQDFLAYQQRLATQGFNAQEIEAARRVGKTDEGIALSLQRRLALQPQDVVGWFDHRMLAAAAAFRELSLALTFVPMFGSVGGTPGMAAAEVNNPNLVRIGEPVYDFQVGNPFTATTTVDLKVRRIDVPADWIITLSTDSVSLAPGAQTTITVTAVPGLPGFQGTLARFAVEGYANGALLGGVEFQVYLPEEQPFLGADRLFLPIIRGP